MELLFDIGNSRLKWAVRQDSELTHSGAALHADADAALEKITLPARPDAVRVANVAGEPWQHKIVEFCRRRWQLSPDFAVTQPRAGKVQNGYAIHEHLGVDRWLAIIAACAEYAEPVCVVDAGTALTVDLVTADRRHLGGYIVPGLDLMREALASQTGNLERLGGRRRPQAATGPGHDTAEAIAAGSLTALCALIERSVALLTERDKVVSLVVTGGDAERLLPHLAESARHRPLLVLEGLGMYDFAQPADCPGS